MREPAGGRFAANQSVVAERGSRGRPAPVSLAASGGSVATITSRAAIGSPPARSTPPPQTPCTRPPPRAPPPIPPARLPGTAPSPPPARAGPPPAHLTECQASHP